MKLAYDAATRRTAFACLGFGVWTMLLVALVPTGTRSGAPPSYARQLDVPRATEVQPLEPTPSEPPPVVEISLENGRHQVIVGPIQLVTK